MKLDYRSPGTGPPRLQQVLAQLTQDEAIDWITIAIKVPLGIALSLAPPAILAVYFWKSPIFGRHLGFWSMFAITSILLVPLLFWFAGRNLRLFLWQNAFSEDRTFFLADLLLFGPRLLWNAYDLTVAGREIDQSTRTTAAAVVVALLDATTGVHLAHLNVPDRTIPELEAGLTYLQQREWIAISARRDRVWLRATIRKRLSDV